VRAGAAAGALHAGLWVGAFSLLAALVARPVFALLLVAFAHMLVIAVSAAKARYLREPLLCADFALFTQALRFPRLYLPYFGTGRAIALAAVFVGAVALAITLEPRSPQPRLLWLLGLVPAALLLLVGTSLARPALTAGDASTYGVVGALWLHGLAERRALPATRTPYARLRFGGGASPHIVAVQSESFFDARRLYRDVRPEVLREFDRLCGEGESGHLAVPVWGAYTLRTEFAFLSGLKQDELGVHRFNPYRRLASAGVATLASSLRARGYRTLCLHPYPAAFFRRDRVFPALGFETFVDLAGFAGAPRSGPYVADAAIAERVRAELARATAPLFIFAITMENHGPLHLERSTPEEARTFYSQEPPAAFSDLTVYLRHLRNADAMLATLAAELDARGRGLLCFYGDHVPGLPAVYKALGYEDSRTDYLLWGGEARASSRTDLAVEDLGLRLLERAGLARVPA
jgi:phosphoglycerol transferase MdoB-like AlkP superfamily enzyme